MLQIKTFLKLNILKKLYIEERTLKNKETRYGIFSISKSKEFIDFTKNFLQFQMIGIQNDIQYATAQMEAVRKALRKERTTTKTQLIFITNN